MAIIAVIAVKPVTTTEYLKELILISQTRLAHTDITYIKINNKMLY